MHFSLFLQRSFIGRSLFAACLVSVAGCTKAPVANDDVDAEPGAIMPAADPDRGTPLSEADTCEMLLEATVAAEEALGCDERATPLTCPEFLRASTAGCAEYARNTVEACVEVIASSEDFEDCNDFRQHPCIVTALPGTGCDTGAPTDASSPLPGDAGAEEDAAAP